MSDLTVNERNEWFINAISQCSTKILTKSDEEIVGILYEDFVGDARAVLYKDSLEILLENNFISNEIMEACLDLREKYLILEENGDGTISGIRDGKEWREVLELGDKIALLKKEFDEQKH